MSDVYHPEDREILARMLGTDQLADGNLQIRYLRQLRFFHLGAMHGGPLGAPALASLLDQLGYKPPAEIREMTPKAVRIDWDAIDEGRWVVVEIPGKDPERGVFDNKLSEGSLVIITIANPEGRIVPARYVRLLDEVPAGIDDEGFDSSRGLDALIEQERGDEPVDARDDLGQFARIAPGARVWVIHDNDYLDGIYQGPSAIPGRIRVKLENDEIVESMVEGVTLAEEPQPVGADDDDAVGNEL